MEKEPTSIDVFAAPGGISLGFSMAGFRLLAAIDHDKNGVETLSYNFPNAMVISKNIRELNGKWHLTKSVYLTEILMFLLAVRPVKGFQL